MSIWFSNGRDCFKRTMDMAELLHRTECLTFPRSGHTLLHRLLSDYFVDGELHYCEMYDEPEKVLDRDPTTNFQKNHDLQLATPIRDDRQYLVQIRYPIDTIISWYKMACKANISDAPQAWMECAFEVSSLWLRFYRKWVLSPVPNRLIVNYSDLVAQPVETLERTIDFLGCTNPDRSRIVRCCVDADIRPRTHYRKFKYYGPRFFCTFKGLYATTPGVDTDNDQLTIPSESAAAGAFPSPLIDRRVSPAQVA